MQSERIEKAKKKYLIGKNGNGSYPYNILTGNYEASEDGRMLEKYEKEREARGLVRSRMLELNGHSPYNPINGSAKKSIQVPKHDIYNPNPIKGVGTLIMQ